MSKYNRHIFIRPLSILFLLLLGMQINLRAQSNEYLLKVGFLEKFARFSDWPEGSIQESFEIKVIGENPFGDALEIMYKNRTIKGLPVKINYIQSLFEIQNCQILFVTSTNKTRLHAILNEISGKPILTISETKGYAQEGVIINFYQTPQGTIHFEINTTKLKQSGIKMDVMLLDFAKIITNKEN